MTDRYMIRIGNKDYRLVAGRVINFRQAHPNGGIVTELVMAQDGEFVFRATITDESGRVLASAFGSCSAQHVKPPITPLEKAETKAVGRALGLAGFGTDDLNDDEDGDGIADSPLPSVAPVPASKEASPSGVFSATLTRLSSYTSSAGKKGMIAQWRNEHGATGNLYIFGKKASEFGVPDAMRDAMLAGETIVPSDAPVVELESKGSFVNVVSVLAMGRGWALAQGGQS